MCCSVLQCVVEYCGALQRACMSRRWAELCYHASFQADSASVLVCVGVCWSVLECVGVCWSVLQRIGVF